MKSLTFSCQTIIYHIPSQFSITVIMLNIQVLRKSSLHEDKSAYTYSIVPFECLQNDTHTFYSLSSVSSLGLIITKRLQKVFSCQFISNAVSGWYRFFSVAHIKISEIFFSQIVGSHNLATPYQKQQSYIHNIWKKRRLFFYIYWSILKKVGEFRPFKNNSS